MPAASGYAGHAGLLSGKAARAAAEMKGLKHFFSMIGSFLAERDKPLVRQAELVPGWDRLDYRADDFEPFAYIEDHCVYERRRGDTVEFVLLVDEEITDVYDFLPPSERKRTGPLVALLGRFHAAAVMDDCRLDDKENEVLLAMRNYFGADKACMRKVRLMALERVVWLLIDDLAVDADEKRFIDTAARILHVDDHDEELARLKAVAARAAVMVRDRSLTAEHIERWKRLARLEGLPGDRLAGIEKVLEDAAFAYACERGEFPVIRSVSAGLRPGEKLYFTARARVYETSSNGRDGEDLVVVRSGPPDDPVLEMTLVPRRLSRRSLSDMKMVDVCSFYLTDCRLLVNGRSHTWSLHYGSITSVERMQKGLMIRYGLPAVNVYFEMQDKDRAFAIIEALRKRLQEGG